MSAEFILGLPYLSGALLARAREIGAPVLVSANAFSIWESEGESFLWPDRRTGKKKLRRLRNWRGFKIPSSKAFEGMTVHLDSAGFVAMAEYRGFPWTVDDYMDLCAARPWKWFASMDLCVEPEIARHRSEVLDRISGTVRLNIQCLLGAEDRGIADRFMPVVQGWEVDDYLRCVDRMRWMLDGRPLVGIGSMCRRHVEGSRGILQVVEALDRHMPPDVMFHLFGLKSTGMDEVRGHPRIASVDSQAYGTAARQNALRGGFAKTNAYLADVMTEWHSDQVARIGRQNFQFRCPTGLLDLPPVQPRNAIESAIARAEERLRQLHEDGEIDWNDVNPLSAYEVAFLDEEEED